jgi:hypothetical protein
LWIRLARLRSGWSTGTEPRQRWEQSRKTSARKFTRRRAPTPHHRPLPHPSGSTLGADCLGFSFWSGTERRSQQLSSGKRPTHTRVPPRDQDRLCKGGPGKPGLLLFETEGTAPGPPLLFLSSRNELKTKQLESPRRLGHWRSVSEAASSPPKRWRPHPLFGWSELLFSYSLPHRGTALPQARF